MSKTLPPSAPFGQSLGGKNFFAGSDAGRRARKQPDAGAE